MSRLVSRVLSIAATAALLAACSSMPEWTKPSTWVDGVTEKKAETKPAKTEEVTKTAAPGDTVIDPLDPESDKKKPVALQTTSDKPTEFPNLSAQPAARQPGTTEAQQREIRDSLIADRDNAQHSADELRGGTVPAAAPPAPAATEPKPEDKPKSP